MEYAKDVARKKAASTVSIKEQGKLEKDLFPQFFFYAFIIRQHFHCPYCGVEIAFPEQDRSHAVLKLRINISPV